jgi:hypothetical protein
VAEQGGQRDGQHSVRRHPAPPVPPGPSAVPGRYRRGLRNRSRRDPARRRSRRQCPHCPGSRPGRVCGPRRRCSWGRGAGCRSGRLGTSGPGAGPSCLPSRRPGRRPPGHGCAGSRRAPHRGQPERGPRSRRARTRTAPGRPPAAPAPPFPRPSGSPVITARAISAATCPGSCRLAAGAACETASVGGSLKLACHGPWMGWNAPGMAVVATNPGVPYIWIALGFLSSLRDLQRF